MSTRMFGPSKEDLIDGARHAYPRDDACGQQQPQLLSRCPRVSAAPGQDLDITDRQWHCSEMNTLQECGPVPAQSRGRIAQGQTLSICPLRAHGLAADRAASNGPFQDARDDQ
jgi:hypothetical protein